MISHSSESSLNSNDYCVIGARTDSDSIYWKSGAAYVYKYNSIENEWNHTQTLYPTGIDEFSFCGAGVAVFENSMIIGCSGINTAYIYKLNETNDTWYQLSRLPTNATEYTYTPWPVDITDGYAIVGAWANDDQATNAGSSYIFGQMFDEATGQESWVHHETLFASDASTGDYFGNSVSVSYDYAIVGAFGDNDNGVDSGSAYIFRLNKSTMIWEQVMKLFASDGVSGDNFGYSVSVDSMYGLTIIGARGNNNDAGASYIFHWNNDSDIWNQTAKLMLQNNTTDYYFGHSVSIYGETCVILAKLTNVDTGVAYEYKLTWDKMKNISKWKRISYFTAFDGESYTIVDTYGDFVVFGAVDADAGYIYAGIAPSFLTTSSPTSVPTSMPTLPTESPTSVPTTVPTAAPTTTPTLAPASAPTNTPTSSPTTSPSSAPILSPTTQPTMSPSLSPTTSPILFPTFVPTHSPSLSPTNTHCDESVQTRDTYFVCKFLLSFGENNLNYDLVSLLSSPNYCDVKTDYFQCLNSNTSITHLFLNFSNIDVSLTSNTAFCLRQAITHGSLIWVDLSNNEINEQITDWSVFSQLEYLSLSNNKLKGLVGFEQLVSENGSSLMHLDLSNNNFDIQLISWDAFEFMPDLKHIDISNNSFVGNIEISYFQYCKNLKYVNVAYNLFTSFDDFDECITDTYMPALEEFIFNNNNIDEQFHMNYFSGNKKLKTIKCNNNSLVNSELDMRDIPSNLETFICGNNDFGEFIWDASPYDDYSLKYIDLTNGRIYGHITMKFFDNDDGGYKYLEQVDLSDNEYLNISINFVYLDGQTYLNYLNF